MLHGNDRPTHSTTFCNKADCFDINHSFCLIFAANRLKKDQSLDSAADKPLIQPWIARTFPLSGDDEASLDFNWKPPLRPRGDTATVSGNSDQRWKVISAEEEDRRNALVLKLSKTHQ